MAFVHGRREAQRVSAACQTGRRVERRGAPSRSEAFPPDPEGRPWPSGQPEALSAFTRGPVWDGRPPRAIKASPENSRQARPKHRAPRWPGREATSPLAAPLESREQDAVGRRARSGPSFLPLRPPVRAWAWRRARAKQVCAATRGHTGLASVPRAGPWPRPDSAPAARVVPLTHMAACVRARVCAGSRLVTDVHALRPLGQGRQGVRGGRGVWRPHPDVVEPPARRAQRLALHAPMQQALKSERLFTTHLAEKSRLNRGEAIYSPGDAIYSLYVFSVHIFHCGNRLLDAPETRSYDPSKVWAVLNS